jgi:hypothetical protein
MHADAGISGVFIAILLFAVNDLDLGRVPDEYETPPSIRIIHIYGIRFADLQS